ncbi:MAG TPA: hypothetical protein VNT75_24170 [Symbiobacteriaceae bacterium]|nr:hypothetical protein [Symbiobacteriaceae bacterium]
MPNLDTSAPGGRESAQENFKKPSHGANATKNNHGAQGQGQQNNMVWNEGAHSFKKGQE